MLQVLIGSRIPFMRYRRYAYLFSIMVMLAGAASVLMKGGFRLGVDFAGGVLVEYRFDRQIETDKLRAAISKGGWAGAEIQASEERRMFLIRIPGDEVRGVAEEAPSTRILQAIQEEIPGVQGDLLREEVVGPRVGRELRGKAFWAVVIALIGILIYVGFRYEFRFALGGVAALTHDVLVVLSFLSFTNKEITIPVIAALLTIGGYSINDTIVVFDRIRERAKGSGRTPDHALFDLSINQTLSRTLVTALTVIFTIEALLFMGGQVIHDFAFAMLVGVAFGTYSSIYVASALALDLVQAGERKRVLRQEQAARMKA